MQCWLEAIGVVEDRVWGMYRRLTEDQNIEIRKEYGSRKEWGDDGWLKILSIFLYFFEFLCAMRLACIFLVLFGKL